MNVQMLDEVVLAGQHYTAKQWLHSGSMVPVQLAKLKEETRCPICFGKIRDARVSMVCLHRYCARCIEQYLRAAGQDRAKADGSECPVCRARLGSRRSTKPLMYFYASPEPEDHALKQGHLRAAGFYYLHWALGAAFLICGVGLRLCLATYPGPASAAASSSHRRLLSLDPAAMGEAEVQEPVEAVLQGGHTTAGAAESSASTLASEHVTAPTVL